MTGKIRFSVVVPSFNQGQFIERALISLFSQGGDDYEVIVVDGGSTDGSVEIIKTFQEKYRQLRVIIEPDNGQSQALNKGFRLAKGEYLTWLNSDDMMLPGTLETIRKFIASLEIKPQWITGNTVYIDAEDKIIRFVRGNRWRNFLYKYGLIHVFGPSSFFTKELVQKIGWLDESLRYSMDWDLWIRFRLANERFVRMDRYLWALRQHNASKTQGGERDKVHIHWEEIRRMLKKNKINAVLRGATIQRFWRFITGRYFLEFRDTLRFKGQNLYWADVNR